MNTKACGEAKSGKATTDVFNRTLPGAAILPMGFATLLNNGPNPEIVLATDFRCPFCATFYARYF